jgi:Uma2 family endonuclease
MMVICDLEEQMNESGYYMGVPLLVLEILSHSSWKKDITTKLNLYMHSGVQEYWIVNRMNKEIAVCLFEDKEIEDSRTFIMGTVCESFIFKGLKVKLENIFIQE